MKNAKLKSAFGACRRMLLNCPYFSATLKRGLINALIIAQLFTLCISNLSAQSTQNANLTPDRLNSLPLAQDNISLPEILRSGESFGKVVARADAYFKRKHPLKTFRQLTAGENRDGEFVKYQRWKSFWRRHLTTEGTRADIAGYVNAERNLKSLDNNSFAEVRWTNISHTNYIVNQIGMGRTTSVGFHPTIASIFYVGTANGGIWKTTDGGQTYVPLGDDLPFLSVSSIVVDKNNPDHIYIAVSDHVWYGPPAVGIYKSTDGGLNWNLTPLSFSFSENIRIYWIEPDPSNPDKMLVATEHGLYMTTDAFASHAYSRITSSNCIDVRYAPGSSDIAYMTSARGEFFKSIDGGFSWSLISNFGNGSARIALTPLDDQKVYVTHNKTLYKSFDQGASFPQNTALGEQSHNDQVGIFSPKNANTIISGFFELYRSDNNGADYNKITSWLGQGGLYHMHVDMRNVFVNPLENDKIYWCNDGGLYRQDVDDNSFENLCDGLIITQFYDIATSQSDVNVVSGGSQDNGSMYRNSSGVWMELAPTGDGMVTEIDPTNAGVIYWEYQNGDMRRLRDGTTAGVSPPGQEGEGDWETPFKLDPTNSNRIIAGYDRVYESTNQGDTWSSISDQLANGRDLNQIAIAKSNPNKIYASWNTTVYGKDPNSNNWTTYNTPAEGLITDLEVDPLDENTLYIAVSGYAVNKKVFKSIDGGANWTNISGRLPNVPVGSLEIYESRPGGLFVGTFLGVYYRDDSMSDWQEFGSLPHTDVRDIEIQYSNQKIRIGTHGRGVFETDVSVLVCAEGAPDDDDDGVCDALDVCPDFDDNLIGTTCDDGDPNTVDDAYSVNCNCEGKAINEAYCAAAGAAGTGADWIKRVNLNTIDHTSEQSAYSDFTAISTDLEKGLSYTITVDLNYSFELDAIYAWIDFNQDLAFDNTEELLSFSEIVDHTASSTFTVPLSAKAGGAIMRVRVIYADPNNPEPCGDYFGEVEDYGINIVGSCSVGAICDDGDPCTEGETYDSDCNCSGGTFVDSDSDGVCDAFDLCPDFDDNLIGTACDDGDPNTVGETYSSDCNCEGGVNQTYCAAAGAAGTGADWIKRVNLNTIDHTSEQSAYSDFTAVSTNLEKGLSYAITVDLNYSFELDAIYAWIDFNQDRVFDNTEELLSFSDIDVMDHTASSTFAVPLSATAGVTTMRVRVIYADPNTPEPCGDYFGEVEDYGINIVAPCNPGTACDDGNPCTEGETYDSDCNCSGGTLVDSDSDGVCDAFDLCPDFDDALIGAACDDGNPCTEGETYDSDCNCSGGTFVDSDSDGVCDAFDVCPDFDDNLIGTACDDGDPNTVGETYSSDCNCEGGVNQTYCAAAGAAGTGADWIKRVRLNTIDNISEQSAYSDFTAVSTNLEKGLSYTITVDLNHSFELDAIYAWIDFNQDRVFDNTEELLSFSDIDVVDHTASSTFTVPSSAAAGATTMRVRVIYADPNTPEPCGDYFGEVEDYGINIIETLTYCEATGAAGTGADWIKRVRLNTIDNTSEQSAYSDFTAFSTDLEKELSYAITVDLNHSFDLDVVYAWIDFNQDGVFDNDEELLSFSAIVDHTASSTFTVPFSAAAGATTMRVRVIYADPNTPEPCGDYFGEVEDYGVNIVGSCSPEVTCDDGDPCTEGETYDSDCNCSGGTLVDSDSDGVCDAFDVCPDFDDALIGAACDDGDPNTVGETYSADCNCEGGVNQTYCAAAGAAGTTADWIKRVRLNAIDHTSDKSAYSDFSAISTDLEKGSSYTIIIDLEYSFDLDAIYAWIDFNQDRVFDNAGELLSFSDIDVTDHTASSTFTVPLSAEAGGTIMRVRVIYADPNTPEPCGDYFGEVEDYGINIPATFGFNTKETSRPISEIFNFEVYPNPTRQGINVKLNQNVGASKKYTVKLYDLTGQLKYSLETDLSEFRIDTERLEGNQVYFISIQNDQGDRAVRPFLKI